MPTPKQAEFHAATEFEVLFGGSPGGGKTLACLTAGHPGVRALPGLRVGAFRRSYPELQESLLAELAKLDTRRRSAPVWNGTEHELRFPNGSLIMFRYAETLPTPPAGKAANTSCSCWTN